MGHPEEQREELCRLVPVLQEGAGPMVLQLNCQVENMEKVEQVEMVHLVLAASYQEAVHHMAATAVAEIQYLAQVELQGAELHHRVRKALAAIHLVAAVPVDCQGHQTEP